MGPKSRKIKAKGRPHSRLLLGVLLLAPGLPVSTVADVPPVAAVRVLPRVVRPQAELLTTFLRRKGFAKPYNVAEILQASKAAAIPPAMIACIEFVESSGGKHFDVETNNPLGWQNGRASFPSIPAAIRHVSWQLGSGQYYVGKTLEEKLRVYNPLPAYSIKVKECMSQYPQE